MNKINPSSTSYRSTPPSQTQTTRRVRNPFENALIERLTKNKPICSPGMCKTYKKDKNGSFSWDIEQVSDLSPADIVACNSQFEPSPDPSLDRIMEESTERFFSQEMVMPSPQMTKETMQPEYNRNTRKSMKITDLIKEEIICMRDVSAQTVLTLPPKLPVELEEALKPYLSYTQDQQMSQEDELDNVSTRRRLFFEEHMEQDSDQSDDDVEVEKSVINYESHTPPVFSPDLYRDVVSKGMKRTFGTPLRNDKRANSTQCYRNKVLDGVDYNEPCFSPIVSETPKRTEITLMMSPGTPKIRNSQNRESVKNASSDGEDHDPLFKVTKRTFGTPLHNDKRPNGKLCHRNIELETVNFNEREFSPLALCSDSDVDQKTLSPIPRSSISIEVTSDEDEIANSEDEMGNVSLLRRRLFCEDNTGQKELNTDQADDELLTQKATDFEDDTTPLMYSPANVKRSNYKICNRIKRNESVDISPTSYGTPKSVENETTMFCLVPVAPPSPNSDSNEEL